jgi:hypothetical protein
VLGVNVACLLFHFLVNLDVIICPERHATSRLALRRIHPRWYGKYLLLMHGSSLLGPYLLSIVILISVIRHTLGDS